MSFVCFWLVHSTSAQQPSPAPDLPQVKITGVQKIPDGGFLFAARIDAPHSKPLALSRSSAHKQASASYGENRAPFSLSGSTIKDLYSGTVYRALPDVPMKPFVGPIDTLVELQPHGWTQLGVAFPPIPPPPLDKDGKKQPYQLLFSIPELKIETLVRFDPDTLQIIIKNP